MEGSSRRDRSPVSARRRMVTVLEGIGGALLCALIVATPWMYGTTEAWSVRLMNIGSFSAGAFLLAGAIVKWFGRRNSDAVEENAGSRSQQWLKVLFLALNLAVLAYCAVALWNYRATFSVQERSFDYREDYQRSLPTTYDAGLTRDTLINLAAFCVLFWGLRYWLSQAPARRRDEASPAWRNRRFQTLLWLISLNGFAIALQGILQRLSGSAKLLWIRESWWGVPHACFGPFSYRGNAAEFLNLVWPVAIGFWWILSRERRRREGSARLLVDGPELLLLPATIVMIAGTVISLSRGGAAIALSMLFGLAVLFAFQKNVSRSARVGVALFVLLTIGLVSFLGAGPLLKRFQHTDFKDAGGRAEIYKNARQIAADYPRFGTGPGSFPSVYHLYRTGADEDWHVFLHDDWLETRITFGWVGFGLILANLLVLAIWTSLGKGAPAAFTFCAATALAGVLLHAKFDFPFQTYSIFFTFVAIAAVLVSTLPLRSAKH